jgi:hypothetical protein|tara:strand:+ start:32 stop:250 length:219 start_codon:yes stop_codon:yes gene_type:complete
MNKLDIQERASAKAFANITSCNIDIRQLSEEIKLYGSQYPFITKEQNEKVLDRLKTERKIWSYIAKLIETDN